MAMATRSRERSLTRPSRSRRRPGRKCAPSRAPPRRARMRSCGTSDWIRPTSPRRVVADSVARSRVPRCSPASIRFRSNQVKRPCWVTWSCGRIPASRCRVRISRRAKPPSWRHTGSRRRSMTPARRSCDSAISWVTWRICSTTWRSRQRRSARRWTRSRRSSGTSVTISTTFPSAGPAHPWKGRPHGPPRTSYRPSTRIGMMRRPSSLDSTP